MEQDRSGQGVEFGVGFHEPHDLLTPFRREDGVAVGPADDITGRGVESCRPGVHQALLSFVQHDEGKSVGVAVDDGTGTVRRIVIDDDHLIDGPGLGYH